MTDEESKKAEAEKVDDDKPSEPGCCFHFGQCIFNAIKQIYQSIMWFFRTICDYLGYCWYPAKERCFDMCECCGKRINQHTDPSYAEF